MTRPFDSFVNLLKDLKIEREREFWYRIKKKLGLSLAWKPEVSITDFLIFSHRSVLFKPISKIQKMKRFSQSWIILSTNIWKHANGQTIYLLVHKMYHTIWFVLDVLLW